MAGIITLDRNMTPRQRAQAAEARPRNPRRLAGGYIADLVALKKAIALCADCRTRFDAARAGYITMSNIPFVQDKCDGCKQRSPRAHLLVHRSRPPR